MPNDIHYEVFVRRGLKTGWSLHDAVSGRDIAMTTAQRLLAEGSAAGVKVVKETFNSDTGDFMSLKIFEDGTQKLKVEKEQEEAPHALPCFKPDDLFSVHARATMARLLTDMLARFRVTVTELIHRADLLEKLEASGTTWQHAIQKVAIAQASTTTRPVAEILKTLNGLCEKAVNRVYRDERAGRFEKPANAAAVAKLAARYAGDPEGSYLLSAAIAKFLADAATWDEKLERLLTLTAAIPDEEAPRNLLASTLDVLVSELLNGSAALHSLLGEQPDLGHALLTLADLFLGRIAPDAAKGGLASLSASFAKGRFVSARAAIAQRVLAELKSHRPLAADPTDALRYLRQVASRLVMGQGPLLQQDDIVAAITIRSRRLVQNETVAAYLKDVAAADERIERILMIEENVIGAENKRSLAVMLLPMLRAHQTEVFFCEGRTPAIARLGRLAQLQARIARSGFQDLEKRTMLEALEALAVRCEQRGKLFESFETQMKPADAAVAVLRLLAGDALPDGTLTQRARQMIQKQMAAGALVPAFIADLARSGTAPQPEAAAAGLKTLLEKAGFAARPPAPKAAGAA